MSNLGKLLYSYRILREKTQKELAQEIGIEHKVLCRLEAGKGINQVPFLMVLAWLFSEIPTENKTPCIASGDDAEPARVRRIAGLQEGK
ncbi:MAG: hypothetical protein ACYCS8_18690 [Acidithiobacillus sp.]